MSDDPFAVERKAIAKLLKDLGELLLSLEKMVAQHQKHVLDSPLYALAEIGDGSFAYRYVGKPGDVGAAVAEPEHYICAGCYPKGIKSPLQKVASDPIVADKRYCPVCKESYLADRL